MKHDHLNNMIRGWFVGNFSPSAVMSEACEVAIQHFKAGEIEATHHHRIGTEVTVIASGQAIMFGQTWNAGDIITIAPGEATSFEAITDVMTVVVKLPSILGDKYPGELDRQDDGEAG